MKIAIIGTRGVPAMYGGFETCAEEISIGLIQMGHCVTVYCRNENSKGNPKDYKGVNLVYLPHLETKNLGTLSHSLLSFVHAVFQKYDLILAFNVGLAPICIIPKLFGIKIVLNVDGLEWKRKKWGILAKKYFQICEKISGFCVDEIVTDSKAIQQYYIDKYKTPSVYIAYGAHSEGKLNKKILDKYHLKEDEYFLIASRLEPENNADLIIEAFQKVKTNKKLVIAGGANYKSVYVDKLKSIKDPRIIFLGPVYEKGHIESLHLGCFAYIHGNEVGGTNPALLKAMGYGNTILTLDAIYNKEVAQDGALYFNKNIESIKSKIELIISDNHIRKSIANKGYRIAKKSFDWRIVIMRYERLFKIVAQKFD
jgi:glycosyltransferase involved in cell wall biosynthesis